MTIPDGTYQYSADWVNLTFDSVQAAANFDVNNEEGDSSEDVNGGTIVVSQGGKKFEFDVTFADGKTAKGTFSGTLESLN